MSLTNRSARFAAIAALIAIPATAANASADPSGIWYDHNGRGAVQIQPCESGTGLCGHVVHVKDSKNADRCGLQILGNVTSNGGGWIYSPSRGRRYTVRLKRLSDDKLRVVGNASSSLFSKTFTWKRAPDNVELCGEYAAKKSNAPEVAASAPKANDVETAQPARTLEARAEENTKPARNSLISDFVIERSARLEDEPKVAAIENEKPAEAVATAKDEPSEKPAYEWGSEKSGNAAEEAPIENDVTEVFDELINKANEYTGKLKRKCAFRIPYVDRVIYIPCKD